MIYVFILRKVYKEKDFVDWIKSDTMDKQKVVVILLVVAIVLSAVNLFMSASFNPGSSSYGAPANLDLDGTDSDSGRVGLEILDSTGGTG